MDYFDIIFKVVGWIVAPVLSFIIGRLTTKVVKMKEEKDQEAEAAKSEMWAIKETCKYMLKKSFKEDYEYYTDIGYCSIEDKNEIEKQYKLYKENFKGNGAGTRYVEGILHLPENPQDKK